MHSLTGGLANGTLPAGTGREHTATESELSEPEFEELDKDPLVRKGPSLTGAWSGTLAPCPEGRLVGKLGGRSALSSASGPALARQQCTTGSARTASELSESAPLSAASHKAPATSGWAPTAEGGSCPSAFIKALYFLRVRPGGTSAGRSDAKTAR